MSILRTTWIVAMLACALNGAWAQDSSTPPATGDVPQDTQQQPVPAYGQDNAAVPPISENPPLTSLDLPSLEPTATPVSFVQPGATFSESAESNAGSVLGGGGVTSVTRALGSLTLRRLWGHYDLGLDYIGGVGYYNIPGQGFTSLQQM